MDTKEKGKYEDADPLLHNTTSHIQRLFVETFQNPSSS